jgi:hypothetical protein
MVCVIWPLVCQNATFVDSSTTNIPANKNDNERPQIQNPHMCEAPLLTGIIRIKNPYPGNQSE